ncbi:hypothetical protein [Thauera sinica]|uniref:Uncharacterized protein n=1 Tax=Thauera sinica TaxID=2665146 RepID=A0ABW1AXG2_9RHOO|nr:hypothetical protein [Thauera sp. K11]ATE61194.1 hypothetical protein CCZ27_15715 [Thauera sp. K11]
MSRADIPLRYRTVTTAAGRSFEVPEHIVRREDPAPAGWQLRYGEWTDYPDRPGDGDGAAKALALAIAEMRFRIDTLGK